MRETRDAIGGLARLVQEAALHETAATSKRTTATPSLLPAWEPVRCSAAQLLRIEAAAPLRARDGTAPSRCATRNAADRPSDSCLVGKRYMVHRDRALSSELSAIRTDCSARAPSGSLAITLQTCFDFRYICALARPESAVLDRRPFS